MAITAVSWIDGDRDERRDGEIYGVRPDNHPWAPKEVSENHRRFRIPGGVQIGDLAYLEEQSFAGDIFVRRRRHRLSAAMTTTLKAAAANSTTVFNQTDLENDLRTDS